MVRAMTQSPVESNTPSSSDAIPTDSLPRQKAPAWVGMTVDYAPLIIFFASYEIGGLRMATIAVMVASLIAVAV
ncbi:MAG TPA: hypothetical protein VGG27_12710, partial [Magnetospirillaceae bacterium]